MAVGVSGEMLQKCYRNITFLLQIKKSVAILLQV
jgi:hypothetical protein